MACKYSDNRVKEIVRDNNFGYIMGGSAIGIAALVAAVSPLSGDPQKALNYAVVVAVLGAAVFIVSSIWNTLSLRHALAEQEAAANLKDAVTDFRADIESVYEALRDHKRNITDRIDGVEREMDRCRQIESKSKSK